MKTNERKRLILFGFSFYSLFWCLEDCWHLPEGFKNTPSASGTSISAFLRLEAFVSNHPSRSSVSGTSSNQVNEIYVIIVSRPIQLTSKDYVI